MLNEKSILVTGGAGFIGSNFVHRLLRKGDVCIINLDALTYAGNLESLEDLDPNPDHHFVLGSIADRSLIDYLLNRYEPWAVVNFAAESHVDRSIDSPANFIQTNVIGTYELLEACRAYWSQLQGEARNSFRFLQVSTDEVYGSLGESGKFTETTAYRPNSPYAASKAASDHLVRAYHRTYGLPVLMTNCSNNYGPYQFPEKLIPLTILNALQGKRLPVYGKGENVRDWLYVEDHCAAIERLLPAGSPGEVYNIGGDNEWSNIDVVKRVCSLLDELLPQSPHRPHAGLIEFVADRPGHDLRYALDATKIQKHLAWRPEESFESGLRKTVEWYFVHQDWCSRVMEGKYKGERLGLK
ncbi:MAG: dTDP-glucose 4,6-dehydratase [Pseudomonadota bacterium]